jgi:hypothetical protein
MYSINIKKTAILLSLVLGFVLISNTSAQAQSYAYGNERRSSVTYSNDYESEGTQVARQYGYEDGLEDGADAGRERDAYHPENSGDWQKGTNGYEDRFGSKSAYKQAYRAAYLQGYRDGYKQYTNKTYTNARNFRKKY